jgi:hypothetical protein
MIQELIPVWDEAELVALEQMYIDKDELGWYVTQ